MRCRNNLQSGGIIWFKLRLTWLRAYLGVKSLGGFGAVSRRSIRIYSVKTSWGTVIMYIHSYLHKWSTQASNGVLDDNGQNLEIGNILL